MDMYVVPIQGMAKKREAETKQKAKRSNEGAAFQDLLQVASQDESGKKRRDGFEATRAQGAGMRQNEVAFVQRQVHRVNEELLAMLR